MGWHPKEVKNGYMVGVWRAIKIPFSVKTPLKWVREEELSFGQTNDMNRNL